MSKCSDIELTQEVVREILHYNPENGELVWKERGLHWFREERHQKIFNRIHAGNSPKRLTKTTVGYVKCRIGVLGRYYGAHQIIWLWMTGEWPKEYIDHIDRDATNNRWSNLREATSSENAKNRSKQRNNSSGVTGVSWDKEKGLWRASVRIKGKLNNLGYFAREDLDLAAMEVMEFRDEHGFHPTHGKTIAPYFKEDIECDITMKL